jgi:hypothetical protein
MDKILVFLEEALQREQRSPLVSARRVEEFFNDGLYPERRLLTKEETGTDTGKRNEWFYGVERSC